MKKVVIFSMDLVGDIYVPEDIIRMILAQVSVTSIDAFAATSRRAAKLCCNEEFWKFRVMVHNPLAQLKWSETWWQLAHNRDVAVYSKSWGPKYMVNISSGTTIGSIPDLLVRAGIMALHYRDTMYLIIDDIGYLYMECDYDNVTMSEVILFADLQTAYEFPSDTPMGMALVNGQSLFDALDSIVHRRKCYD